MVTTSGSGGVTEESVSISFVCNPDSYLECKTFRVLGLGSLDTRSAKNSSESVALNKTMDAIFRDL